MRARGIRGNELWNGNVVVRGGKVESASPMAARMFPRPDVSMKQTTIEDLKNHVGETVTLKGWLYNLRSKGKIHFLQVRDGTGICQAVMVKDKFPPEVFERVGKLGQESSLDGHGHGARRRARAGRLRDRGHRRRRRSRT